MLHNSKSIIFFGTSEFAIPILEALHKESYEIVAVVTTPDSAIGRKQILTPPPIKVTAQKLGFEILQPQSLKIGSLKNSLEVENLKLKIADADVGVVASYGKIIPKEIISSFPKGILNIHPSLLPKYRGPSPIQHALFNGDKETGITIILLDEKVDHGPVVARQESKIINYELWEELHNKLAKMGAELLVKTLPDYLAGKIKPKPQENSRATFTKIITKEDGKINWHKKAKEIHNQFRAFHKWPGIYTLWQDKILKIIDCKIYLGVQLPSGKIYQENEHLFVPCSKGRIELLKLQFEGGKVLTTKEFINGYGKFLKKV